MTTTYMQDTVTKRVTTWDTSFAPLPNHVRVNKAEFQRLEREQIKADLREFIRPGSTIHHVLRHVSRSGMSRRISFYVVRDGDMQCIDYQIIALGLGDAPHGNDSGVVVGGCGMDMGFSVVHNLGYSLWPNGTPEPHSRRNGEPDSCGGYALKSRWM